MFIISAKFNEDDPRQYVRLLYDGYVRSGYDLPTERGKASVFTDEEDAYDWMNRNRNISIYGRVEKLEKVKRKN